MALTCMVLALALPVGQTPGEGVDPATGAVGKFYWPPRKATVVYEASLTKQRKLPKQLAAKVRAARKAAGLFAPGKEPAQRVAVVVLIQFVPGKELLAKYETKVGKQTLRMKVQKPKKGKAPGEPLKPLGNDRVRAVWGGPDKRGDKPLQVPSGALDRQFEKRFAYKGRRGVETQDLRKSFGDHLLPVLWNHPLPCWIGEVTELLDLSGEAIIAGKTLIRDGTRSLALGYRETRVAIKFLKASTAAFTMTYELRVEQRVSQERGGASLAGDSYKWRFNVKGTATYSLQNHWFERIEEKVTAVPVDLPESRLAQLRDEAFEGTIRIVRKGTGQKKGKKKRRRR